MAREQYMRQVALLVRTLPFIARHNAFALKGGTAINLFYRDMPRLSVDIDLTYLPIEDRETTLKNIDAILDHIREDLQRNLRGASVQRIAGGGNNDTRVLVRLGNAEIKIETSPVARGTVHPPERRRVSASVEDKFGFAEMQIVSFEDLFGGKLHAAVDRQHPRDLFDVKLLYENEGLTDALFRTFLIYIASSGRPPHELVRPSLASLDEAFVKEFEGMTTEVASIEELKAARERMTKDLLVRLDSNAMRFLLSLHDGEPDFDAIGLPQAAELPAVRWKLLNLEKLRAQNPAKHAEQRREIEALRIHPAWAAAGLFRPAAMDVDEVEQAFDAVFGEGHGPALVLRVVDPDQPVFRFHVEREISEPVFVLAEIAGDERQCPDGMDLVDVHRQAAIAAVDAARQFQGRSWSSLP